MAILCQMESILDNQWVKIGIAICLIALSLGALLLTKKKNVYSTKSIVVGAVCVSIAAVLNLFKFKTGALLGGISGSVTLLRMLPLILYSVTFGPIKGVLVCVCYGLVDMLFGLDASGGIIQVLLDYIVGFGVVGLSGLARSTKQPYVLGTLIALVARTAVSFISGAVFFGMYAPENMNVWLYSIVYQCVTVVPDMLLVLLAFALIQHTPAFKQTVASMLSGNSQESTQQND